MTLTADRADADLLIARSLVNLKARAAGFRPVLELIDLHPGQCEVLAEAERFNVLCAARRWGKTALYDHLAAVPVAQGKTVFWFSLTYDNLVEVWEAVKRTLAPYALRVREQLHRIDTWTGGVFEMFSLWQPISVRGRRCHRAIIDEAAHDPDLETTWTYVVRPTLVDFEGDAWFLSTPKGFNYFEVLWKRGQDETKQDGWKSWQRVSAENPHLPPDELARVEEELPPEVFAQEFLAQFTTDATQIFSPAWWLGRNRYDPAEIVEHPNRISGRFIFWDTALKDKEENAYSARVVGEVTYHPDPSKHGLLLIREVWRGRPQFPALVDEITSSARYWNHDGKLERVVVEDKASGTSAVQTIRASAPAWLADRVSSFEPKGSKVERWSAAAVWCKRGSVLLPLPGLAVPWLRDLEDELYAVPFAAFKDQADALAELILYLENFIEAGWRGRAGDGVGEAA